MNPTASLYERLGRVEGITRIVDDVMEAHLANPVIGARFRHTKDLDHAKRMAVAFFCAGTGGPQAYPGKSLPEAHRGMNINEAEYMAAMDDILGALNKHRVDAATQGEVTAVLYAMKEQVLRL
jgi:hemoglobin